jgi:hypothetical protein
VSTDEQIAELAAKLRLVPQKFSPGQPGQYVSDFDELARVALDHCAAQPAAGGLSDEELAKELYEADLEASFACGNTHDPSVKLAVARRARELCPAPPPEPPMPTEEELATVIHAAWHRGDAFDRSGRTARAAARALHRTLEPGASEPECLGAGHCMEHEVLPTSHHPDCPRFDKVRQPARIITAAHFAEISALRAELAGLSDELLRLRAELADARGRLADVIQAATTPGGGA